jgi:hypothetical protein
LQLQQLQETTSFIDQDQDQDQEAVASFSPAKLSLPPHRKEALHQSAPLLPTAPLQGHTSSPTEEEEDTQANSFHYDTDMLLSDLDGIDFDTFMKSCEKTEQHPHVFVPNDEFIAESHTQYQHHYQQDYHNSFGVHNQHHYYYPKMQNFPSGLTQDNNSCNNHSQHQNYHQEIGGAFAAAPGLHQADAQHLDQSSYGHAQVQYYNSLFAQTGYYSPGQFTGSAKGDSAAASGSDGDMSIIADAELFAMGALRDDDPLDCLGTL